MSRKNRAFRLEPPSLNSAGFLVIPRLSHLPTAAGTPLPQAIRSGLRR
ncbi:MAG: hypothetical protein KDA89_16385 [Planctomycetaceae bacterium]|nr:hypothetical protein [Planctomycetaceae bacterium]